MKLDTKTIYAQSSDVKSRTYLQYRRDMKQKAIAELEILSWLQKRIKKEDKSAVIEKHGGDKFIWFLRKGGITRDPDFVIKRIDGQIEYVEFQYAQKELKSYDFKISKIAPKDRKLKKRIPREGTVILYIIKPICAFAVLRPSWIIKNSKQTIASAWGNAPVFRVFSDKFNKILKKDIKLNTVCEIINKKNKILNFQHTAVEKEKEKLSYLLQQVVDAEKILNIMPKGLDGFFKICFILSHIQKSPKNAGLWIVYLLSFLSQKINSYNIFQLIYSLDFLYPKVELKKNEINKLVEGIKMMYRKLKLFSKPDGSFHSDKKISPLEDTRYCLFAINILEDLTQDILFYYGDQKSLMPIKKIYQTVPDINRVFNFIQNED